MLTVLTVLLTLLALYLLIGTLAVYFFPLSRKTFGIQLILFFLWPFPVFFLLRELHRALK